MMVLLNDKLAVNADDVVMVRNFCDGSRVYLRTGDKIELPEEKDVGKIYRIIASAQGKQF